MWTNVNVRLLGMCLNRPSVVEIQTLKCIPYAKEPGRTAKLRKLLNHLLTLLKIITVVEKRCSFLVLVIGSTLHYYFMFIRICKVIYVHKFVLSTLCQCGDYCKVSAVWLKLSLKYYEVIFRKSLLKVSITSDNCWLLGCLYRLISPDYF